VLGWLLTPLVAWAACLFGAWVGTVVGSRLADPMQGLGLTILLGAVAGFGGLLAWMRVLRRRPRLRKSLHVTREGIPITADLLAPEANGEQPPRA
jgi:hypothetical protein